MRERVLVTGAGGFIGSHLCEALLAQGWDVVGLEGFLGTSYDPQTKRRNLRSCLEHPAFTLVECDLRDASLEPHLDGVHAVINEAAMPGLPQSWADFPTYLTCNVLAVQRLIEACRATGVQRFVQASTSSVYGLHAIGDESQPKRPVSPYGVTKLAAEHLLNAYARVYDFPVVILRYFSIYGPRQRPDMAYQNFIERMFLNTPIMVHGDGLQSRANTYVSDCVRGTIQALNHAVAGEAYNIGGGVPITLRDAVRVIADLLGVEPWIIEAPARPGDQRHAAADFTKARRTFGYEPTVGPEHGLARQVAAFLADDRMAPPTPGLMPGQVQRPRSPKITTR